jgi:hypothetical protein
LTNMSNAWIKPWIAELVIGFDFSVGCEAVGAGFFDGFRAGSANWAAGDDPMEVLKLGEEILPLFGCQF